MKKVVLWIAAVLLALVVAVSFVSNIAVLYLLSGHEGFIKQALCSPAEKVGREWQVHEVTDVFPSATPSPIAAEEIKGCRDRYGRDAENVRQLTELALGGCPDKIFQVALYDLAANSNCLGNLWLDFTSSGGRTVELSLVYGLINRPGGGPTELDARETQEFIRKMPEISKILDRKAKVREVKELYVSLTSYVSSGNADTDMDVYLLDDLYLALYTVISTEEVMRRLQNLEKVKVRLGEPVKTHSY
ncbi:MAG: hypothetical protein WCT37_05130 [Patescibacteria group bacterium]